MKCGVMDGRMGCVSEGEVEGVWLLGLKGGVVDNCVDGITKRDVDGVGLCGLINCVVDKVLDGVVNMERIGIGVRGGSDTRYDVTSIIRIGIIFESLAWDQD